MFSKLPPGMLLSALKPALPKLEELSAEGANHYNKNLGKEIVFTLKTEYDDDALPVAERVFQGRMYVVFAEVVDGEMVPFKSMYFTDFLLMLFNGMKESSEKDESKLLGDKS